jgi:hypothetical protein
MADDKKNDGPLKFDSTKYASTGKSYYAATDDYANKKETFISFYHVPSGKSVYFKAFITSFNESFSSDWTSEQVFGRADPIQTFKQNQRNISLNFKVPAAHAGEAYTNLARIQKLIQFLYPAYSDPTQANTLQQSPLVRMKVMNLLRDAPDSVEDATGGSAALYDAYTSGGSGADSGLLGVITNLAVNHNLEGDDGVIEKGQNTVLPKLLDVAVSFTVIHEHSVGWNSETKEFADNRLFPYGVQLSDMEPPSADDNAQAATETNTASHDEEMANAARALDHKGGFDTISHDYSNAVSSDTDFENSYYVSTGEGEGFWAPK